jgi:hypothetical protein
VRWGAITANGYGFMSVLFLPNSKNKKDKNKIALKPMLGVRFFKKFFFGGVRWLYLINK